MGGRDAGWKRTRVQGEARASWLAGGSLGREVVDKGLKMSTVRQKSHRRQDLLHVEVGL